jgi:DNA-binding SARP family transcriptional activator
MHADHMVRVLGPIDVITSEGSMPVGGRQTRALLGALVIGADHAVPIEHLNQVLWDDDCPSSASNTLQSYVSQLRGLLGSDAIVRTDHCYQLIAGIANVDALRFEKQLNLAVAANDDPEACRNYCGEALHLWRGRPFGDLADDRPFKLETYRLEELRLVAMEHSLAADLALGHHDLVVGELENAVQEHPYREDLWYLLVEALAGSGRRVEALRTAARLRRTLAEAGLQAGERLVDVEQRILHGG